MPTPVIGRQIDQMVPLSMPSVRIRSHAFTITARRTRTIGNCRSPAVLLFWRLIGRHRPVLADQCCPIRSQTVVNGLLTRSSVLPAYRHNASPPAAALLRRVENVSCASHFGNRQQASGQLLMRGNIAAVACRYCMGRYRNTLAACSTPHPRSGGKHLRHETHVESAANLSRRPVNTRIPDPAADQSPRRGFCLIAGLFNQAQLCAYNLGFAEMPWPAAGRWGMNGAAPCADASALPEESATAASTSNGGNCCLAAGKQYS